MNTEELYLSVPVTVFNVFHHVVKIFRGHWRPLVLLTAYSAIAFIASFLLLALAAFLIGAEELILLQNVQDILQSRGGGDQTRNLLLEFASTKISSSGVVRLLENTYYYYYEDMYDDQGSMFDIINSGIFGLTAIVIYILWILVLSLVSSIFSGAMAHAVAEVYVGNFPIAQNSLEQGWANKWTIFGYNVIIGLSMFFTMLLTIVLPVFLEVTHTMSVNSEEQSYQIFTVLILGMCLFLVISTFLSAFLVAAVPSIICERKSTIGAFRRSFGLCKGHICFLIGSYVTYHILLTLTTLLINLFLSIFPSGLAAIGHLIVTLISTTIGPILSFVLYMSMRIREENLTKEEFANEMGSSIPVAIEVSNQKSSGKYIIAATAEVV